MAFNPAKILILLLIFSVSLKLMVVEGVDYNEGQEKVCTEKLGNYKSMKECEGVCKEGCLQRRSTFPGWSASCLHDAAGFYCSCTWLCN
ncbi:hypothetical protein M5689_015393 [Euphorbia peplus]|nr:hypothetical protein M5689_015393 [Euphorbia peplus]